MRRLLAAALLLALGAPAARAQLPAQRLIDEARIQLEAPNPDSAAVLLEQALDPAQRTTVEQQARAFVLYGIAQLMRDNPSVARASFREALRRDASLKIDSLYFFHELIEREFGAERAVVAPAAPARAALAVEPSVPADTTVPIEGGRLRIEATPSYRSQVVITISPADLPGQIVWGDTQLVGGVRTTSWNLRGRDGAVVPAGRYALRVYATDSVGQVSSTIQRVLQVSRVPVDTQPHARALQPGDFRPETLHLKRGSPAGLAIGLALGAAAAVLPTALGATELNSGQNADGTAYAVAGAVSLAGIVGFVAGRRMRVMPDNIRFNQELRQRDTLSRQAIVEQNRRARESAPIQVRLEGAGP